MYTLGLDIGTNSIGWALLNAADESILDVGVRIFPIGVKEEDYDKSFKEVSKNATRRLARGARRNRFRRQLRKDHVLEVLDRLNLAPDPPSDDAWEIYALRARALDEKLTPGELGRVFLHLSQRRGFKSNRKAQQNDKETGVVKEAISTLTQRMRENGARTLGEYFHRQNTESRQPDADGNPRPPAVRIRGQYTSRQMYEQEFDAIWRQQARHYRQLTGGPDQLPDKTAAYHQLRNYALFYQRPLRSAKHLVGKCPFEPTKTRCPKASLTFQDFRLWQTINDLRVTAGERVNEPLTTEEKQMLAAYLEENADVTLAKAKKTLGLPRSTAFNDFPSKIKGNASRAALLSALGEDKWNELTEAQQHRLWHTLYHAQDTNWLVGHLRRGLVSAQNTNGLSPIELTEEQIQALARVSFESDYGSLSLKAIRPILAHLREGMDYADACLAAGYHHSYRPEQDSPHRSLRKQISALENNELRNPIVQQTVAETIRLVNALVRRYGAPRAIRLEMARELKQPKEKRERRTRTIRDKAAERDRYAEFLSERLCRPVQPWHADIRKYEMWLEMGMADLGIKEFLAFKKKVSPKDQEKYRLWLEADRRSVYTGRVISLSQLFSEEIEIEHIVPYSQSMDNSFVNKTLSERSFNRDKDNRLPYAYFQTRPPAEWQQFKDRVKAFSQAKQERLLMQQVPDNFLNSQLTNTAYAATEVLKKLKTVCADVQATNGQATGFLRRRWGLNAILNQEEPEIKKRGDHRHHAVDALVVALTTRRIIRLLSRHSQFDALGKMTNDQVPDEPWPGFRRQAGEKIHEILVSYRNKQRLLTPKKNKIKVKENGKKVYRKSDATPAVRGALHEDTVFGKIENPAGGEEHWYVTRKPLSWFDNAGKVEKIVDEKVQKILQSRLARFEGNAKKAFADLENDPVYMHAPKSGIKIPIRRVRVHENFSDTTVARLGEKRYAKKGNNYLFAIYEDPDTGERTDEIVSFFDAVQRKQAGEPVAPAVRNGKPLLFALKKKDMVVLYDEHPEEINWDDRYLLSQRLYRVIKFSQGSVVVGKHFLAKIKGDKDPEPIKIKRAANTLRAVKVRVTETGEIRQIKY